MAYLLIDDGMGEHPKVEALSDADFRAHFRAMCWCARRGTDGHIPPQTLRTLGISRAQAVRLVSGGVWEVNGDGGHAIHDFLEFNPPADPEARRKWHATRRKRRERDGGVTGSVTDA